MKISQSFYNGVAFCQQCIDTYKKQLVDGTSGGVFEFMQLGIQTETLDNLDRFINDALDSVRN